MTLVDVHFSDLCKFTPRQKAALRALKAGKRFLLYGGALGGGKSYFLRWVLLRRLMELYRVHGIERATVMLACEDYPSLKDRQLQKIGFEFPEWLGTLAHDHKTYGRSFVLKPEFGGGAICFRNLDDPSKYQSAEFAAIGVDELTKNEYDIFTFLRSRLRWPGLPDAETWFVGGTNPGGIGHGWVKQLWIDQIFPDEWTQPIDFRPCFGFVQSKADDNPHLDPAYWATLQTLPPNLRAAFRDGDWDIFVGQAFPQFSRQTHTFSWDGSLPEGAPLYSTFDWGYGKPFSWGWWFVDADGRVHRFAEWYGWSGTADEGLRLEDSKIAEGIRQREQDLGIWGRPIIRLAGHDSWNKKPDYQGGGQGPSTAEVFAGYGIYLTKADSTRAVKIRQFRERLRVRDEDNGLPMLMVADTCAQFLRTIPNLVMDERQVEDVDTDGEDHIYDEACQICMARPLALKHKAKPKTQAEKRIEMITKPLEQSAHEQLWSPEFPDQDDDERNPYDDGGISMAVDW